jgi:hypothetical protein
VRNSGGFVSAVDLSAVETPVKKLAAGDLAGDLAARVVCEMSDGGVASSIFFCAFSFLRLGCMLTCKIAS